MDKENKKVPKGVVDLIYLINKLEVEEFFGVCKILGVEIYEKEEMDTAAEVTEEGMDGRRKHVDESFKKTPRQTEFIMRDVVDKLVGLNRVQRRNLKRLVKAATKGGK